jgi:phospholipid-binding lipoprotein MlaA
VGLCAAFVGCATLPEGAERVPTDPWERMNRSTFAFNESFDAHVAKPIARGYVAVTPRFVRTGVGNFFGNIADVYSTLNIFLQGNIGEGFEGIMRVGVNTTFGLLGFLDVASEAGIQKRSSDLGETLGVWGVGNGPYFVIPLLGPSVVRNTVALPADYYGDLWSYYDPVWARNTGSAIRLIDKRASLLDVSTLLEDAALDKYIFVRDAYLQRVESRIQQRREEFKTQGVKDGEAPPEQPKLPETSLTQPK